MVLAIPKRIEMPKELQSKLKINPFVSGPDVTEESAIYNQQQLTDALIKTSLGEEPSDQFRAPKTKEEYQIKDLKQNKPRSFDDIRTPKYLQALDAVTEREAFDYWRDMQNDESGIWADPARYGDLSRVELDAMRADDKKNGTNHVMDGMKRFQRYLRGRTARPDQPIYLKNIDAVKRTMRMIQDFKKASVTRGYGDLLEPLKRPVKSLNKEKRNETIKKSNLTVDSANALVEMVNNLEKAANVRIDPLTNQLQREQEESFLNEVADSAPGDVSARADKTNWDIIEEAYGVQKGKKGREKGENSDKRKFFTSTVVAGLVGIVDHLRMIKSDRQALSAFLTLPEATMQEALDAEVLTEELLDSLDEDIELEYANAADKKDNKPIRQASIDNLRRGFNVRNEQPILNSVIHKLDTFIRENLAPGTHGNSTMEAPGSLIRWFTEQGYISWGRTKSGYLVPVIKENHQVQNLSQSELATAYDPALRQKKYSAINASTFPITDDFNVNERGDWKKFLNVSKDITGRSSISQAFLSMMKNTPVSIDGEMLEILKQIHKSVLSQRLDEKLHKSSKSFMPRTGRESAEQEQIRELAEDEALQTTVEDLGIPPGGSTHPLAKLLGEIDTSAYNIYAMRDARTGGGKLTDIVERKDANGLVNQHMITITNRLDDIIKKFEEQEKSGVKQNYLQWYKSGATGRYFVMDALFNHINDKGLLRTVLNIGHKTPLDLNQKEFKNFNSVRDLAKQVYGIKGKGLTKWEKINAELHKLPAHKRQLMGFFYAMGKTADHIGIVPSNVKLDNPLAAINHGINSFDTMAARGASYRSWITSPEGMTAYENMDPIDQKVFSKKGEWQYPLSIAMDASKLKEAIANNDNTFNFNFKFEQDAQQSNAAMQSLLTGDSGVAGLLGIISDMAQLKITPDGEQIPAKDLRDLLLSNIDETVDLTLNNDTDDEKVRASAVRHYFKAAEKQFGSRALTRGLIIAGLYGKYPGYMYTEVQDMLGNTNSTFVDENGKQVNLTEELRTAYSIGGRVDDELLQRDLSQIYLQMANEHMRGLMGYQELVKSVGKIFGAFDGPTEIAGFYPKENIVLAIEELHNTTSEKVVNDAIKREGSRVGGWFYPNLKKGREAISASPTVTAQRAMEARQEELQKANEDWKAGKVFGQHPTYEEAARQDREDLEMQENIYASTVDNQQEYEELMASLEPLRERVRRGPMLNPTVVPSKIRGEEDTTYYKVLGSQVSRAFPVVAIQNMDSLALGMAFMIANGNKMTPPAATAIHDAIISTADSVLLLNNAYNNIVPNVFARGGKEFLNRVVNGMWRDVVNPILRSPDDAKFNIGTEVVYSSAEAYTDSPSINPANVKNNMSHLRNLSGVTNYFDEIHYRYLDNAKEFLAPEQKSREKIFGKRRSGISNETWGKHKRKMDELVLSAAKSHGWLPPGSPNRKNYSVSGKEMKHLLVLILEREGLLSSIKRDKIKKSLGIYNVSRIDPNYSAPGLPDTLKAIDNATFKMDKTYKKYLKGRKQLIRNLSEQTKYNSNLD